MDARERMANDFPTQFLVMTTDVGFNRLMRWRCKTVGNPFYGRILLCLSALLLLLTGPLPAADEPEVNDPTAPALPAVEKPDLEQTQKAFWAGQYTNCIAVAEKALKEDYPRSDWSVLLVRSLLVLGRYPEAYTAVTNAQTRHFGNLRLQWLAYEVFRSNGMTNEARATLQAAVDLMDNRPWAYREAPDLVVSGQIALELGKDPRLVLEKVFDTAKKADATCREVYLASGNLALSKHDYDLASKTFQEGIKHHPQDADLLYGLAKAYESGSRASMLTSLEAALTQNSNHVPSLLLMADHLIDAEQYAAAEKFLEQARRVNPWQPEAWAYQAVISHLRNDASAETAARTKALKYWDTNPLVDHLIGMKLSEKYRFAEGAEHQRQALRFEPEYLPAKAQLAQDLLRLGEETEGWRLAEEVQAKDGYDVAIFNLVTLRDTMSKYTTLTNRDFVVRMNAREASVYGQQVLELLGRAKSNLCAKYGVELDRPVVVEIFPDQRDFGVRTFGLPENPGYLGVCFGPVITANSPAVHFSHPVNWQSVLWHEFTHVLTLQLTRNKMPRWLSEGISVYEERLAQRGWGQNMNPSYRTIILEGNLAAITNLSAAFLSPKSEEHLDFAYYESSLVVEYLVEKHGLDRMQALLKSLGEGMEMAAALEKHVAPLAKLEADFAAYARQRANALAPDLDWEKLGLEIIAGRGDKTMTDWAKEHPTNYWALRQLAQSLIEANQWQEAKAPLEKLIKLYPDAVGPGGPYVVLARAQRELKEEENEKATLTRLAALDANAPDAYLRLMEMAAARQEWAVVATNAQRYLAVNPLVAKPYRFLAEAVEALGQRAPAMAALQALLKLDPPNPAEAHYRLARLLREEKESAAARRQVLEALEESPRYREALKLLLEINREQKEAAVKQ